MLPDRDRPNIYTHQQRGLAVLLGWATGSIVTGIYWWQQPADSSAQRFWQSLGSQFAIWGLIDLILAIGGLRDASAKAPRLAAGNITPAKANRDANTVQTILTINAILDVFYMLTGLWLIRQFPRRPAITGAGWGVLIQGAFLFLLDTLFARAISRHPRLP